MQTVSSLSWSCVEIPGALVARWMPASCSARSHNRWAHWIPGVRRIWFIPGLKYSDRRFKLMQVFRLAYLPNVVCVVRIGLVVPIMWFLVGAEYESALLLIIIAGFSDWVDGFLARRFGWESRIGGLLDPLADKLLFVSVFAALTWNGLVPLWLFAVVIGRDIIIVSGAFAYEFLIG
ncbi:MAG: hypothetical protein GQ538_10815, partial [Xanthomonadales bacterium]|nr:hypothetical protein [Xanthomonadales bacterium]